MKTIHLALAFDDDYIEPGIVLMTSVLLNKADEKIHFHILDMGLSSENKKEIFEFSDCKITFHLLNDKEKIFWKILLPEIVQTERIIYLDADIVVKNSLKELWQTNLSEDYIGVVENFDRTKSFKFNSGVMLVNAQKWLEDEIPRRAMKILQEDESCEEVLNKLFEEKIRFLDLKWNFQCSPMNKIIKQPYIIHYTGGFKPWIKGFGCFNPMQKEYFKYHKLTDYAYSDYKFWQMQDKLLAFKGLFKLIKRRLI
ncbi:MAG: glycosyltransferase family 8 protein [Candidatus Gastranaerophilales bacterium]|nr:glycosyltransferase family 8 protein [Candidatus Gastranaerophilales bacterium]